MKKVLFALVVLLFTVNCWAIFCPICGNKNPDEAKYCMKCGRVLIQEQSKENTSKIIIEPQSFEDKLSYAKYQDWKDDYEAAKFAVKEKKSHVGLGIAGLGVLGYFAFANSAWYSGYAPIFAAFAVVGLIMEAADSSNTTAEMNLKDIEDIGRKNGWLYN